MGDVGSKKAEQNTCTKCFGNDDGVCRWGGDTNIPPPSGRRCIYRIEMTLRVVFESKIARGQVCHWPVKIWWLEDQGCGSKTPFPNFGRPSTRRPFFIKTVKKSLSFINTSNFACHWMYPCEPRCGLPTQAGNPHRHVLHGHGSPRRSVATTLLAKTTICVRPIVRLIASHNETIHVFLNNPLASLAITKAFLTM